MRKYILVLLAAAFLIYFPVASHSAVTPGTLKWSYATGNSIYSSAALGIDGTIYVGSWDTKLYAINPDGTLKWSYTTGGKIFSSPAIGDDGTIYVGSEDKKLYAITDSTTQGTLKWTYTTGSLVDGSPVVGADGTIYVGSYDQKLYALTDMATHATLKWSYATGNAVSSSPAIGADGTIYVGSQDHKLYAVNHDDGSLKWSYDTADAILSSPAIGADGTIYVGANNGNLYAISPKGARKWVRDTGGWVLGSMAIGADGTIYVGTSGQTKFYAINPKNGSVKWSYEMASGAEGCSPAIGLGGLIYMGAGNGMFYAFNPDGTVNWTYDIGHGIYLAPAIGINKTIYIGSTNGTLYALNSSSTGPDATPWPMFHHDAQHTGRGGLLLAVYQSGTGAGAITSSPSGIACGSKCFGRYVSGTKITLTPAPQSGSVFKGWTDDCAAAGTGKCSLTMTSNKSVGAVFDLGSCTYTPSSSAKTLTYKGGKITVGVTAKDFTFCAPPDANPNPPAPWITYAATFANNKGSVSMTVPALDSYQQQAATFTIGNKPYTVTQKGRTCSVKLTPANSGTLSKDGDSGTFNVAVTPSDCSWSATADSKSTWVHPVQGAGKVDYTVDPNGGAARTGKIIVTYGPSNKTASFIVKQGNK